MFILNHRTLVLLFAWLLPVLWTSARTVDVRFLGVESSPNGLYLREGALMCL